MRNTPAEQGEGVDNQLEGCGDNPTRNPEKCNGAKARFTPAVDVIRPTGGMLRVSYGMAGGEPAISLEAFRKAGEPDTTIGKVLIATAVLFPALEAMIDAGNRAIDEASEAADAE